MSHRRLKRRPFRPSILEEIACDPLHQHLLANCPEVTPLVKATVVAVLVGFAVVLMGSLI